MKNRNPKYPGRVQLTPVPGQANTYDMVRADEPTEPGSIYSRGNVLPDDVCSALGLDSETAEPKDAFNAVHGRVGDIKITTRADLGANWALCNGTGIKDSDYPEMVNLLPPTIGENWIDYTKTLDIMWRANSTIKYLNGRYFIIGSRTTNGGYAAIASGTSLTGSFSVWNDSTDGAIYDITYGGGYYVACGMRSGSACIWYSTTGTSWAPYPLGAQATYGSPNTVAFGNGRFVIAGVYNSYFYISSASSSAITSWSVNSGGTYRVTSFLNMIFDTYASQFIMNYTDYSTSTVAQVYSSTGTSWSARNSGQSISGAPVTAKADSEYVLFGKGGQSFYHSTSMSAAPTVVDISGYNVGYLWAYGFINGIHTFLCGTANQSTAYILTSDSLDGVFAVRSIDFTITAYVQYFITHNDVGGYVAFICGSNSVSTSGEMSYADDNLCRLLPLIPANNAYAYIRLE